MFDYDDHIARAAGDHVMAVRNRDLHRIACRVPELDPSESSERLVQQTFHRLAWLVDARVLFLDPAAYVFKE